METIFAIRTEHTGYGLSETGRRHPTPTTQVPKQDVVVVVDVDIMVVSTGHAENNRFGFRVQSSQKNVVT